MTQPKMSDLDLDALGSAITAQFADLPPTTREHLMQLADAQGGFPWAYQFGAKGVRVVWADVTIAEVPYALVMRHGGPTA